MKALGRGSVASVVEPALVIAWWGLLGALGILAIAVAVYVGLLALLAAGVVDQSAFADAETGIAPFNIKISGVDMDALRPLEWADWQIILPAILIGGVAIGGSLIIVRSLRRLFDSFRSDEPFRKENAAHLRVIWIAMVVMELSRYALLAVIAAQLGPLHAQQSTRVAFNPNVDPSTWMSIAILIVLAEVFREGARMKEEQELTI